MKKAVFVKPGLFEVQEVPKPVPGGGEVLLKVTYCGICGSDMHLYANELTPTGITPGHEWVATVVEVGPGVTDWKVGDRAVKRTVKDKYAGSMGPEFMQMFLDNPAIALAFHKDVNAGGFSEYMLRTPEGMTRVPEHVTDEEAALADTIGVAVGAIENSPFKKGDSVLIIGGGAIGLSMIITAKAFGASKILVSEPVAERREIAKELGADEVLDPLSHDVRMDVLTSTGGGANIVFDCVGSPATIQQAVDMVCMGGTVILVGLTEKTATIVPLAWMVKQVTFKAQMQGDIPGGLKLIAEGKVPANLFITGKAKLDDIQQGFKMAVDAKNQIKVYICNN